MIHSEYLHQYEWERSVDKENIIKFDFESSPETNFAFEIFVEKIYDDYDCKVLIVPKTKSKSETARLTIIKCLRTLIWHFYRAQLFNHDCYICISMSSNTYCLKDPKNPYGISRKILDVIHHLEKYKYINFVTGFLDRSKNISKYSRIRPNIDFMERLHKLPRNLKSDFRTPISVVVRNKGSKKNLKIDNTITDPHYLDAVDVVSRYNKFILKTNIHYTFHIRGQICWVDKKKKIHKINMDKKFLHSVIHRELDGSLTYFRMHGAFWQNIPSEYRKHIQIDGEKTICLDYSAQIINIVGSIHNIQVPENAYHIDLGYPSISSELSKVMVKKAVMIFTNCDNKSKAYNALRAAIRDELEGQKFPEKINNAFCDHVYACIINKYPFFEQYMFHDGGTVVFKNDAEIARMIMNVFLKHDKAILPIHDGFIVAKRDYNFLHKTMMDVWFEKFGTTIEIKQE